MLVTPTKGNERYAVLDALRGFALFGILLANLYSFLGHGTLLPAEATALPVMDRVVLFGIDWFVEGKFYSIFSMLLGMGFALQYARFTKGENSFSAYWLRRMMVLLVFGLMHMMFVWNGDILTLYSLLGALLLLFINIPSRQLFRITLAFLSLPIVIHIVVMMTQEAPFWGSMSRLSSSWQDALGYGKRTLLEMRTSDSVVEVFSINVLKAIERPMSYLITGRYVQVLGVFLLGVLIVRTWIEHIGNNRPLPVKYWLVPGIIGLIFNFGYACTKWVMGAPYALDTLGLIQALLYHIGAPCMALGIAGAFLQLWSSKRVNAYMQFMVPLGRMALSNYILQNVIAVLIFFGYGLGLMGQVAFSFIPLIAVLILFIQWRFSLFWLHRYQQGPLELIWKKVAYRPSS